MSNLDLIDWRLVGFSALWIVGLSVILATLSFADYRASQHGLRLRDVLRQPRYQAAATGGGLLFCAGLAGSARAWWETLLWLALGGVLAYSARAAFPLPTLHWRDIRWRRLARNGLLGVVGLIVVSIAFVAVALPDFAGLWSPRHYLIVAQNQDELRPTGGFITGVALITVSHGQPAELEIRDANLIDDYAHKAYPAPPAPLQRLMGSQLWLFRDANWSLDFPTAAREAISLYRLGQSDAPTIDGLVAFDQTALGSLLTVLGPLSVPGLRAPVTADNVLDVMRQAWSDTDPAVWQAQRKDFMVPLAQALLASLRSVRDPRQLLALAGVLTDDLAERHVLVYAPEAPLAGWLARQGWDGSVQPGQQDYLRLVDSNVGFNKVNASVRQQLAYTVDLTNPDRPLGTLTATYASEASPDKACVQFAVAEHSTHYADYYQDCYWDYWRLLVPRGAQIDTAPADNVLAEQLLSQQADRSPAVVAAGVGGTTEIAGLFVLPPTRSQAVTVSYSLPATVLAPRGASQTLYRLRAQKQPGTAAVPIAVTVAFPSGWTLVTASPAPAAADPGQIVFDLDLRRDLDLQVMFRVR